MHLHIWCHPVNISIAFFAIPKVKIRFETLSSYWQPIVLCHLSKNAHPGSPDNPQTDSRSDACRDNSLGAMTIVSATGLNSGIQVGEVKFSVTSETRRQLEHRNPVTRRHWSSERAVAYMEIENSRVPGEAQGGLDKPIKELKDLAEEVEKGVVDDVAKLDDVFTRIGYAMAKHHYLSSVSYFENTGTASKDTGKQLAKMGQVIIEMGGE
jgi:hypothetical protein